MTFIKAVKTAAKIRLALAGPSGSGKTFTALTLAQALADGKPVAVIDTERGSASKYSDIFSFDVMELDTFHPDKFTAGIREAEAAGYAVLVIDSLSHAWNGTGGLLEIVEAIGKRSKSGSTFNAWGEATPIQNRLIDAITRSKMHIICTMRSKQEYILESVNGKSVPRKVGMAPVQRNDLEYEFDIFGEMDYDNNLLIQKSRCPDLSGKVIAKPDSHVADILKIWLQGVAVENAPQRPTTPPLPQQANHSPQPPQATPAPSQAQQNALVQEAATEKQVLSIRKLCEHLGKPEPEGLEAMSFAQAKTLIEGLTQEYRQSRSQAQSQVQAPVPASVPAPAQVTPDIAALQKLCHEVLGPGRWAYAKEKVFSKNIPDKDMTEAHRVVLYTRLKEYAASKQGNGNEAA